MQVLGMWAVHALVYLRTYNSIVIMVIILYSYFFLELLCTLNVCTMDLHILHDCLHNTFRTHACLHGEMCTEWNIDFD